MLFKKLGLAIASLVLISFPAFAQTPAGILTGRVADATGLPLPGVTVTVQGPDMHRTFTTDAEGRFRFLELAPGDYQLTSTLAGFTTNVRPHLVIGVGQTLDLPVTLAIGALTEIVNVTAPSPMIDARQTGTATSVTIDELTNIPTSRDPFSLLRSVNGVLVDRVNVGGNETGQQSNFVSKGTRPQDAVWTMDGVAITDMTLTGSSPTYFNWDNFEAVHVAAAGPAITQQTGGPGLDFIVKRGTNLFHGSAPSYFDNDPQEGSNVPAELAGTGGTPAPAGDDDRDLPSGQRLHRLPAARALQGCGRPRHQPEHVPHRQVRVLQHRLRADAGRRHGAVVGARSDRGAVLRLDGAELERPAADEREP